MFVYFKFQCIIKYLYFQTSKLASDFSSTVSVYIDYSHRRNFSVLRAKLIVLLHLDALKMVVKLLKWIKIYYFRLSTLDF
jgi:hypothetical protein